MPTIRTGAYGYIMQTRFMSRNNHLIVFVRNPVKGKVKTRLASTLGNEKAFEIYLKLLEHTRKLAIQSNVDCSVFCDETPALNSDWNNLGFYITSQRGDDLGERMTNAFKEVFEEGADSMIIIGSDCPGLTADIIDTVFEKLREFDLVLGPAKDGGYYLLGMNRPYFQLFENINWSTSTVLTETKISATELGLNYIELQTLSDIDEEGDLKNYPDFFL